MNITASAEKIQEVLQILDQIKSGRQLGLDSYLPLLIGSLNSQLMLFELLSNGGNISQVRKLFGLEAKRQARDDIETQTDDIETENQQNHSSNDSSTPKDYSDTEGHDDKEVVRNNQEDTVKKKPNANHPGKAGVNDFPDAPTCHHNHHSLKPGDPCPECGRGKVYLCKPRERLLFEGQAPITPIHHIFHDLACSLCKKLFKAPASAEAAADGLGQEDRYGYSAIAMITVMKFFSFLPYYRFDRLTNMLGFRVPDSSQFDQTEKMANALAPIQKLLMANASSARLFMADDATGRILEKSQALIPVRSTGKLGVRDGCHSSVVIAFNDDNELSVLIKTDIIHAGEWLDQILGPRSQELPAPQIMWDRLSSNSVTVCPYIDIACNQHARQNFKNLREQMPKVIDKILADYKSIFTYDSQTHSQSREERLAYHQEHSSANFESIFDSCQTSIDNKLVTENSELGKAFQYVLTHQSELSGFLKHPGAPVSNNLTERVILYLVLLRRVSHFFRTPESAAISDTIMSVGLTAFLGGVNLFHYFRLVMLHSREVKKHPEQWLPDIFLKRYPDYKIKYKSRAGRLLADLDTPYIPMEPPT